MVRVDAGRAAQVEAEGGTVVIARHPDGSIDVEVPCASVDAFRSWLFGLGTHGVVLGPADVRAEVIGWFLAPVARLLWKLPNRQGQLYHYGAHQTIHHQVLPVQHQLRPLSQ